MDQKRHSQVKPHQVVAANTFLGEHAEVLSRNDKGWPLTCRYKPGFDDSGLAKHIDCTTAQAERLRLKLYGTLRGPGRPVGRYHTQVRALAGIVAELAADLGKLDLAERCQALAKDRNAPTS